MITPDLSQDSIPLLDPVISKDIFPMVPDSQDTITEIPPLHLIHPQTLQAPTLRYDTPSTI